MSQSMFSQALNNIFEAVNVPVAEWVRALRRPETEIRGWLDDKDLPEGITLRTIIEIARAQKRTRAVLDFEDMADKAAVETTPCHEKVWAIEGDMPTIATHMVRPSLHCLFRALIGLDAELQKAVLDQACIHARQLKAADDRKADSPRRLE